MPQEQLAKEHGFELLRELSTTDAADVYLARKGKAFFVLKWSEDMWNEREALKVWSGNAAPVFEDLGQASALEYLSGRHPFHWKEEDLPKLLLMFREMENHQVADLSSFRPLADLVEAIGNSLKTSDSQYRDEALLSLDQALAASGNEERLIHGDLHPWNIFMRDRATIIDPLGLRGDPGFDLAHLAASMAHDQEEFLEKMNRELGYETAPLWFPGLALRRLHNTLLLGKKPESRIAKKLVKHLWEK